MRFWIYNIETRQRACPQCGEPNKFVANQKVCNQCVYIRKRNAAIYKRKFYS